MHPIFEAYTLEELERRSPYSMGYLVSIRDGQKPARPWFRKTMASILRESTERLFVPEEGRDA